MPAFKKGSIPWNKGKKYKGIPRSEYTKKKISLSLRGENHIYWKGKNVGYSALHKWVSNRLGKPKYCAYCHTTNDKRYEWANISHSYQRDLSDWIRLCCKCHSAFDLGKIKL